MLLFWLNFSKLCSSPVLEVFRVEFEEGHDFIHVKSLIEVVVKRCAELINRERAKIDSISLTVVYQMGSSIDIVPLDAIFEILEQKARIDRRELLHSIPSQLLDQLIGDFMLTRQHSILKQSCVKLCGLLNPVGFHLLKDEPEMTQICDRLTERLRKKRMANVNL